MSIKICPSLLSANICNLEKDLKVLEEKEIEVLHIDIMDGNFVPNIAFGIYQVEGLRKLNKMEFDSHLMVENADLFVEPLVKAGTNGITVHLESSKHLYKTLKNIKSFGIKAGVALNPSTPVSSLEHVLPMLDRVLIMSVEPGFGGQEFIPFSLDKIRALDKIKKEKGYDFTIQVDGGINADNIKDVIDAGIDEIVIGSSLFKGCIEENIDKFRANL